MHLFHAEEHLSVRGQLACKVSLFHLTVASQLLPSLLLVLFVWLWLGCFALVFVLPEGVATDVVLSLSAGFDMTAAASSKAALGKKN